MSSATSLGLSTEGQDLLSKPRVGPNTFCYVAPREPRSMANDNDGLLLLFFLLRRFRILRQVAQLHDLAGSMNCRSSEGFLGSCHVLGAPVSKRVVSFSGFPPPANMALKGFSEHLRMPKHVMHVSQVSLGP